MQKNNPKRLINYLFASIFRLFRIRSLTIYQLTLLVLILASFISVGLISSFWIYSETVEVRQEISKLKENTLNKQKDKLKDEVTKVLYYLNYRKDNANMHNIEILQEDVLNYFKNIRFGNDGYIFINDYEGNALLFDGQKVDGTKNISDLRDPSGLNIFETELKLAQSKDGGFFQYYFERINDTLPQAKISYVKGFDSWGWIIGTGDYLDDIDTEIKLLEEHLKSSLHSQLLVVFGVFAIVFILTILFANLIASAIQEQFNKLLSFLKDVSVKSIEQDSLEEVFIEDLKLIGRDIKDANDRVKQFGDIIEQSKNEIYIFGVDDFKFVHANRGALKNSGYSLKQLNRMTLFQLMPKLSVESMKNNIKPLIDNTKEQVRFDSFNLRKNKSSYPVEIHLTNSIFYGQKVFVAFIYDITAQKRAEMELIYALDKAKESDRLKSAFLANMSHEIRTPMNGILGFSNLLKIKDLERDKYKEYVEVIEKSGIRMLDTINSLMDISKIEAGQMDVFVSDVDINSLLVELFDFFQPEAEAKGLTLILNKKPSSQKLIIKSDREKIYSILSNLLKNAIKYTKVGNIEFGYTLMDLDIGKSENYSENNTVLNPEFKNIVELLFFVKDTGIGIPKDRLHSIFERFIQVEIEDKNIYEGTGLGLSISKAFVEMLGGEIWVSSDMGKGSEFYFSHPYSLVYDTDSKSDVKPEPKLRVDLNRKLKILIAEDDVVHAKLLSIIIKDIASEIIYAKTGLEALKNFKENPDIDLILLDIKMPKMNGYEVAKGIRKFNKEVIIIAQTAFALIGDRELAFKSGCNDHLSKPIDKLELLNKINILLG